MSYSLFNCAVMTIYPNCFGGSTTQPQRKTRPFGKRQTAKTAQIHPREPCLSYARVREGAAPGGFLWRGPTKEQKCLP